MRLPEQVLFCALLLTGVVSHRAKHERHEDGQTNNNSHEELSSAGVPEDHRFFLQEIFHKYGSHGVMSYEGFEHLLENLGLGRLSFDKSHNVSVHRVNGTFQDVHDELELHRHDHQVAQSSPRQRRDLKPEDKSEEVLEKLFQEHWDDRPKVQPVVPGRCLTPQDILTSYGLQPHHDLVISPASFVHLCPAIVYELDQRSCYDQSEPLEDAIRPSPTAAWLYATVSILAISLTGLLGVAVVPLIQKAFFQQLLHFLVALAVGTLCGDALLHLLPHALESTDGIDNHTTAVLRAATTFSAMVFFFLLEAIIRLIRAEPKVEKEEPAKDAPKLDHVVELGPMLNKVVPPPAAHGHAHHHHHHHPQPPAGSPISSVAWMVIMGDGLHNLTDGLAIGAAFAGNTVAGLATTLAVFCHELPHELGDFAVLLKSGMSIRTALYYNIFSSVLSFIGMAVGVLVGEHEETTLWVYAATAGIFLYIGLSDLIPEMSTNLEGSRSLQELLIQIVGLISGGGIMLAIALYEDNLRSVFG